MKKRNFLKNSKNLKKKKRSIIRRIIKKRRRERNTMINMLNLKYRRRSKITDLFGLISHLLRTLSKLEQVTAKVARSRLTVLNVKLRLLATSVANKRN